MARNGNPLPPIPCAFCDRSFRATDAIIIYETVGRGIVLKTPFHESCIEEAKEILRKMHIDIPREWQ